MQAILRALNHFRSKNGLWNYREPLSTYFEEIGTSYAEAEERLRQATSGECLYFKSDKGQQLEALIFAAISLAKDNVSNILEIGTGSGANTVILSSLFPKATIHTYDLPRKDRDYNALAWRATDSDFSRRISRANIVFHEKNSFHMLSEELPKFDLVFVDGGHSYPAVAWDTRTGSGGFIVFHDYNRPNNDPTRDANHVKDLMDNYFSKIIEEKIVYLPWAGYDREARTCLVRKR